MSWRLLASACILAALAPSLAWGGLAPASRRALDVDSFLQDVYTRYGRRDNDTWLSTVDDGDFVGRYAGWVMLSICCVNSSQQPSSQQELLNQLLLWERDGVATITNDGLLDGRIQLAVAPPVYPLAIDKLNHLHLSYKVVSEDIEEQISNSFSRFRAEKTVTENFFELHEVEDFLKELQRKYPDQVKLKVVGESVMKKPILEMTVLSQSDLRNTSESQQDDEEGKSTVPIILIDSAMHAREWLTVATSLHALQNLLEDPSALIRAVEWRFMPVVNPDGYLYSWEKNRFWRKNRRPYPESPCVGVDINRNFDIGFGGIGSSIEHCSDEHHGGAAFSEPEARAVRDAVMDAGDRLKMYLSLHSYGQLFLLPWAYSSNQRHHNIYNMTQLAKGMAEAIHNVNNTEYFVGTIWEGLYPASGISSDWVAAQGVPNSIVIELQDKGRNGFLWPESEIEQAVTETWEGIKYMGEEIWRRYVNTENGPQAPNIPPVRNDVPVDVDSAIRDRIITLLQHSAQIITETEGQGSSTSTPSDDQESQRIVEDPVDIIAEANGQETDSKHHPSDPNDKQESLKLDEDPVDIIAEADGQETDSKPHPSDPNDKQESLKLDEDPVDIIADVDDQEIGDGSSSDNHSDIEGHRLPAEGEMVSAATNSAEEDKRTTPSGNWLTLDMVTSFLNGSSNSDDADDDTKSEAASIATLFDKGTSFDSNKNFTGYRNTTSISKNDLKFVLLRDFVPQVVTWSEKVVHECMNNTDCKIRSYINNVLGSQASMPVTEITVVTEIATETVTEQSPEEKKGRKKIVLTLV